MDGLRSFLILATGVAIGGALVIAHRVSVETGKSMPEAFADVPAEALRIFEELKGRGQEAVERAREAYDQKQAEMDAHLRGGGPAE
jgi:hypothetical protein